MYVKKEIVWLCPQDRRSVVFNSKSAW